MDDVRGGVVWPPHGTTPAVVIKANKTKTHPLRPVNILMRKGMDHTAAAAT